MTDLPSKQNSAIRILTPPFRQETGYAWLAAIDIRGDGLEISQNLSDLQLLEDGVPLGPGQAAHGEIRKLGFGRYSHWVNDVYFATSDNSNPNCNNRVYSIRVTERDRAEDRARFGINIARGYATWLRGHNSVDQAQPFKGLNVFELGPGPSLASAMAMVAMGAKVFVREREPLKWNRAFHGATAREMINLLQTESPHFDLSPLHASLEFNDFDPQRLIVINASVDETKRQLANVIDYVISTAVLEHVEDLESELSFLYSISKKGSLGIHSVDFKDHHMPNMPLEFLALSDEEFLSSCLYRYSRGSRVRLQTLQEIAVKVGYAVHSTVVDKTVDSVYVEEFVPRLRASESSYKNASVQDLQVLDATLFLKK